jgi:hypothetical protein
MDRKKEGREEEDEKERVKKKYVCSKMLADYKFKNKIFTIKQW